MIRHTLSIGYILGLASILQAQYPAPNSGTLYPSTLPQYSPVPTPLNYLPNYFNRQSQPLSPYLNLLNGGIPGLNYYYGVRPGLPTGAVPGFGNRVPLQRSQLQGGLFPSASTPMSPTITGTLPNQPVILPPSGHPVIYGNAFGQSQTGPTGFGPANRSRGLGQSSGRTIPKK